MKYALALSALVALASAVPQQQPSATAAVKKLPWYESTGNECGSNDEQCLGTDLFCDFWFWHKQFPDRRACLEAHERPVDENPKPTRTPEEVAARDRNQAAVVAKVKGMCPSMYEGWGCGWVGPNCVNTESEQGKETDMQKRVDEIKVCLEDTLSGKAFERQQGRPAV